MYTKTDTNTDNSLFTPSDMYTHSEKGTIGMQKPVVVFNVPLVDPWGWRWPSNMIDAIKYWLTLANLSHKLTLLATKATSPESTRKQRMLTPKSGRYFVECCIL